MWNSHFPPLPEHPSGFINNEDSGNISGGVVDNNAMGGDGANDVSIALTDGININDSQNLPLR